MKGKDRVKFSNDVFHFEGQRPVQPFETQTPTRKNPFNRQTNFVFRLSTRDLQPERPGHLQQIWDNLSAIGNVLSLLKGSNLKIVDD